MKMKKYIAVMCAASMLAACSDWDDHYDASSADTGKVSTTLWQAIQSNPRLSDFADLVEKAGRVDLFTGSQTSTVWAPVNGSFDPQTMEDWLKERLDTNFVRNHVARNSYLASGDIDYAVRMFNNKVKYFYLDDTDYIFGGQKLEQMNIPCVNGVLHLIDGQLSFLPNIYETLNNPEDSISYYMRYDKNRGYHIERIDEEKSTKGSVEDGEITYRDPVTFTWNLLFDAYHASIIREDSSYTMIVPNNEAWNKAKAAVEKYFNYIPSFTYRSNTSSEKTEYTDIPVNFDTEKMRDSLIHKSIMRDLFYNNRLYSNKLLENYTGQTLTDNDSLCSTGGSTIYGEDINRLLEDAQYEERSNGGIYLVDSLRMRPWTSWCPPLQIEAGHVWSNLEQGDQNPIHMEDRGLENDDYLEIVPNTNNAKMSFYLTEVRSATYVVYVVVVPDFKNTSVESRLPNRMRLQIGYNDEKGALREKRLGPSNFENDPTKVDTIRVDEFTFPICYTETGAAPYVRLEGVVTNSATHDRTMRIDKIMLIPKELDDYMKEHPDYKHGLDDKNSYVKRY